MEDAKNRIVPVKKHIVYPPSTQAKMQLKRGDFVEFENDGQLIKATIINREKATGRFYN